MTTTPRPSITTFPLSGATTGPFATGWRFAVAADVQVWVEIASEPQAPLMLGPDYSVTASDPATNGGTVQLSASVIPDGGWPSAARLILRRRTARRQATALPDIEGHKPRATERALDKQMLIAEEDRDDIDRALLLQPGLSGGVVPWTPGMGERFLTIREDGRPGAAIRPQDFDVLGKANLIEPDFTRPTVSGRPIISAPALFFPTYVDDISGVVTGGSSNGLTNSAAINAWLAANPGKELKARPGAMYRIGARIDLQNGSKLTCESVGNRAVFYMTTAFSNTNFTQRDTVTACGFLGSGQISGGFAPIAGLVMENLIVQCDPADGRVLRPIYVRNALHTKLNNVDVTGVPCGVGMCLSGLRGDTRIDGGTIYDFITNVASYTGTGFGQLTAIEFDNDIYNGIVSESVRISGVRIDNLTPGAVFKTAYGDQSDGINIAKTLARAFVIDGLLISRVNEALDVFGQENSIVGGTYSDCRGNALKFIHGAKRNAVIAPNIVRPWLGGIVFAGSSTPGVGDTAFNTVSGGVISDVNPTNAYPGSSCGIRFQPNNGAASGQLARNNTVTGTVLLAGAYSNYGWLDEAPAGANARNVGEGLDIPAGWLDRRVYAPNGGGQGGARLKRSGAYTEDLT